jgi:hypothetical protein
MSWPGRLLAASNLGALGSFPSYPWGTNSQWGRFFPCQFSFHQCSILIYRQGLVQWAHLRPQYQGTQSHPTPTTKITTELKRIPFYSIRVGIWLCASSLFSSSTLVPSSALLVSIPFSFSISSSPYCSFCNFMLFSYLCSCSTSIFFFAIFSITLGLSLAFSFNVFSSVFSYIYFLFRLFMLLYVPFLCLLSSACIYFLLCPIFSLKSRLMRSCCCLCVCLWIPPYRC